MTVCKECGATEQGTIEIEDQGETVEVCKCCHFPADEVMVNYDEDYGSDR